MPRRAQIVRTGVVVAALLALATTAAPAQAASSNGCEGGGFRLVNLDTGATVAQAGADRVRTTIPAAQFGSTFGVRGRYAQFDVRAADFAVLNQAFTGAANPMDMTGGRFTPVFASKVPDHRGLDAQQCGVRRARRRGPRRLAHGHRPVDEGAGQGLRPGRHLPDGAAAVRRHDHPHHAHARDVGHAPG